jgi:adenine/guanine phosphoribosyltransferase-like PRPP-binding protein
VGSVVIDDLGVNVVQAAIYVEPGALGGTQDVPAGTLMPLLTYRVFIYP